MDQQHEAKSKKFADLGIASTILFKLNQLGFKDPTPIQEQAIPVAITGSDIVGIAQTGTGKTLAFGIPMIQRLHALKGRGLIVLPTRELAVQVEESLRMLGASFGLRTAVLIGGAAIRSQMQALAKNPHVVIGTPGRINDHLQQKTLLLHDVKVVVLDEADRMLDMGFAPQIAKIFQKIPNERQTMLFSATMPGEIMRMAAKYMKMPVRVEVATAGTPAERVTQEIYVIPKDAKSRLVEKILEQYTGTTLIFTRTKFAAKKLAQLIRVMGHTAIDMHSDRSLKQRQDALAGFKTGRYRVLIATDIASRGIDVTGIQLVINYDLPTNAEDYVHRIGRTARAGTEGHAISLVAPDQRRELNDIERLIKQSISISRVPDLPPARAAVNNPPSQNSRPPRQQHNEGFIRQNRQPFRRRR